MMPRIEVGQFVSFTYNPPVPPPKREYKRVTTPVKQPDGSVKQVASMVRNTEPPPPPPDPNKQIFVMHPNWHNKVHGIDIKGLTPAEQQVLHAMMDPKVKAAVDAGQWPVDGAPPYALLRDILRRTDPTELIKNPMGFYNQLIKPFISGKDVYRQYHTQYMSGLRVIAETKVQGQVTNPRPLFHR